MALPIYFFYLLLIDPLFFNDLYGKLTIGISINSTHTLRQAWMSGKPRHIPQVRATTGKEKMAESVDISNTR